MAMTALTVRLDEGLKSRMRVCAAKAGTSLNAWIGAALAETVEIEEEAEREQQARPQETAPAAT